MNKENWPDLIADYADKKYGSGGLDSHSQELLLQKINDLLDKTTSEDSRYIPLPFHTFLQARANLADGKQPGDDGVPSEVLNFWAELPG